MDKKPTDSEIKSALKGAILNAKSLDCKVWSVEVNKLENALDLITRLQAKNEEYQKSLEKILAEVQEAKELYVKDIANAKAEAYKECIEKVKWLWGNYSGYEFKMKLDNLLKELGGEQ